MEKRKPIIYPKNMQEYTHYKKVFSQETLIRLSQKIDFFNSRDFKEVFKEIEVEHNTVVCTPSSNHSFSKIISETRKETGEDLIVIHRRVRKWHFLSFTRVHRLLRSKYVKKGLLEEYDEIDWQEKSNVKREDVVKAIIKNALGENTRKRIKYEFTEKFREEFKT